MKVDPRYSTLVHLGTLATMLIAGYDRSVTLWTGGTRSVAAERGKEVRAEQRDRWGVTSEKGRVPVAWVGQGPPRRPVRAATLERFTPEVPPSVAVEELARLGCDPDHQVRPAGRWASVALSTVRREDLALGVVARIHRSKSQAGANSPRRDATGGFDREPTGDGRIELVWIRVSALGS